MTYCEGLYNLKVYYFEILKMIAGLRHSLSKMGFSRFNQSELTFN